MYRNQGKSLAIGAELAGMRLDAALGLLAPAMGLRGRRRLAENGLALVNGRVAKASRKLRTGDLLELASPEAAAENRGGARLLAAEGDYCFYYKPPDLHSCSLQGSTAPSLQAMASELLATANIAARPELLQRLDFGTSGIICAALNPKGVAAFRKAENRGLCRKYYLALLCGKLLRPAMAKYALDCANRKRSAVLKRQADPIHWTLFAPLWNLANAGCACEKNGAEDQGMPLTLALCSIQRGQRHQIRAHAAALGHPLFGDSLYGQPAKSAFFLEHFYLSFPGHEFFHLEKQRLIQMLKILGQHPIHDSPQAGQNPA